MTTTQLPPTKPAAPPAGPSRARRLLSLTGPLLGLLAVYGFFFVLIGPRFASHANLESIAVQSAVVAMAALGMTFIIASAGIDLSVGSAVALSAMTVAWLLKATDVSAAPILLPLACALAGVLTGTLCGLVNGSIITGLRLMPFIVTLGTMMIFRGITKAVSLTRVNPDQPNWVADLSNPLPPDRAWLLFPPSIYLTLLCALLVAGVLHYTRFGRHALAIGSNENTARLVGIRVGLTKVLIYTFAGVFIGLAGVLQYARTQQGDPSAQVGLELAVIAAVVIGGASLAGGRASVLGTLAGALIINVINTGCSQLPIPRALQPWLDNAAIGLPTYVQEIVTGAIIIAAVALDHLRHRRQ